MSDTETAETAEIAARNTDEDAPSGTFTKTFRIKANGLDAADSSLHAANKLETLQAAIQQGLHPKGDVYGVSAELVETTRRGDETWDVVYGVDVVTAGSDEDHNSTVTPSSYLNALGGTTEEDDPEGPTDPAGQAETHKADAEPVGEAPAKRGKTGKA